MLTKAIEYYSLLALELVAHMQYKHLRKGIVKQLCSALLECIGESCVKIRLAFVWIAYE